MQQEVSGTGKKKGAIFTRPKTFAAHVGGRRPGVIYAVSPTLKKKIRETKDPLEKSMLANSGWRGEASLISAVEIIKTRHTAFLHEMDDRHEKILAENNKKRAERAASMQFAKSAGALPKQPSVMRELFPVEPRVHGIPHKPQLLDFINPNAPSPTPRLFQPVQYSMQPVPQLYPTPTQHPVQSVPQLYPTPTQHPVQNVPQPFHHGGQEEETITSIDNEDSLDHQPRARAVPVAQSSAYLTSNIEEIFNSMADTGCSKDDMEQFSQIISSLADAYHRLDIFIKSKK